MSNNYTFKLKSKTTIFEWMSERRTVNLRRGPAIEQRRLWVRWWYGSFPLDYLFRTVSHVLWSAIFWVRQIHSDAFRPHLHLNFCTFNPHWEYRVEHEMLQVVPIRGMTYRNLLAQSTTAPNLEGWELKMVGREYSMLARKGWAEKCRRTDSPS